MFRIPVFNDKLKQHAVRLALLLLMTVFISDLSYSGAYSQHTDSTTCFLTEVSIKFSDLDFDLETILNAETASGFFLFSPTRFTEKPHSFRAGPVNVAPHGWFVPHYLDHCVFII